MVRASRSLSPTRKDKVRNGQSVSRRGDCQTRGFGSVDKPLQQSIAFVVLKLCPHQRMRSGTETFSVRRAPPLSFAARGGEKGRGINGTHAIADPDHHRRGKNPSVLRVVRSGHAELPLAVLDLSQVAEAALFDPEVRRVRADEVSVAAVVREVPVVHIPAVAPPAGHAVCNSDAFRINETDSARNRESITAVLQ